MHSSAARIPTADSHGAAAQSLLLSARALIEDRFLRAGNVLVDAISGVNTLVASLDGLAATFDASAAADASNALQEAGDGLSAMPSEQAARRTIIERLLQDASGLNASVHGMRRDSDFLRLFAINLQITAGGVSEAGIEFSNFVNEIQARIGRGCKEINAFAAQAASLHQRLREALENEDDLQRECLLMLAGVPERLATLTGAIGAHQGRVRQILADVRGPAANVQKKAGSVLAALQIGDITRQRIEHVCDGLTWLDQETAHLSSDQHRRFALFINRLLAAQAFQTAQDFHTSVATVEQNMATLSHEASAILSLRDLAFGEGEQGGFLKNLNAQTSGAFSIVNTMEAGESRAIAIGAEAAESARALSAAIAGIQKIRSDVQNMALNTTLRCTRFGDSGRPLHVIASELRTQAGNLERNANTAFQALERLAQSARLLEDHVARGGAAQRASGALGQAVSGISSANEALETQLVEISAQGLRFIATLSRAADTLRLERDLGAPLDRAAAALADDDGSTPYIDDLLDPLRAYLARLAKIYTMASERELHQRMSAEVGAEIEHTAAAPVDDDDLLF